MSAEKLKPKIVHDTTFHLDYKLFCGVKAAFITNQVQTTRRRHL